jgi:hypothetical protein
VQLSKSADIASHAEPRAPFDQGDDPVEQRPVRRAGGVGVGHEFGQ